MIRRLCMVLVLVCIVSLPLWAQTNKGSISGTVFDPTGAVVPGANVTITNIGTGHQLSVQSSERGTFQVPMWIR